MKNTLVACVQHLELWFIEAISMELLPNDSMVPGKETLTRREAELLYQVSKGKTTKEIAGSLYISEHTVRKHTKNIYRKLSVHNKIEALHKTRWLLASLFEKQN